MNAITIVAFATPWELCAPEQREPLKSLLREIKED